jgi:hypothetical protein
MVAAKGVLKSMQLVTIRANCWLDNFLAISDAVRTSLGPKGMDKMVEPVLASSSWIDLTLDPSRYKHRKERL